MIIDVVTIFPNLIKDFTEYGVIKEAFNKDIVKLNIHNLRDFTRDKHKKVDDKPYGGGYGMVMMVQPFYDAVKYIKNVNKEIKPEKQKTILFTPRGKVLDQKMIKEILGFENIIMLCGRYEGVDERVSELVADLEVSVGDYILTGGELPAMIIIDAIARLMPGVIHSQESLDEESFEENLLEYPQYTRPLSFLGKRVPDILVSGNHAEIKKWRRQKALEITKKRRPDLFDKSS